MGVAAADFSRDGRADLFVTNSRGQLHAAYRSVRAGGRAVRGRTARHRGRHRNALDRLGRLMGRPRSRRRPRPRPGERRDPGREPREGRPAGPGPRERLAAQRRGPVRAVTGSGLQRVRSRQRARARSRRLRQRRRPRCRRQRDRRAADPPREQDTARPLARGSPSQLRAGRTRHRCRYPTDARSSARCSPGAATSRPRILASTSGSATRRSSSGSRSGSRMAPRRDFGTSRPTGSSTSAEPKRATSGPSAPAACGRWCRA